MAAPPFKVKAVYEYSSPHDDDLNFPNGQIITVTEEEDADWYVGEYTDASGSKQSGLFPKNFVEKYEPSVPSRPTRPTRPKEASPPPPAAPAEELAPEPVQEPEPEPEEVLPPPVETHSQPPSAQIPTPSRDENVRSPPQAPQKASEPVPPAAPKPAPAPPASSSTKSPPPISAKPTGNSFKDRIAAFNKPAAAPIAPFKPGQPPSGFIKKPFVAPPPSKNAYIPPPKIEPVQKVYRREEDPEIAERQAEDQAAAEKAGLVTSPQAGGADEEEDAPKPQSLKERIALLQKQQMEQAARRADTATKEKPKKPVKKRTESSERIPTAEGDADELERVRTSEHRERQSVDTARTHVRDHSVGAASREPTSPQAVTHEPEIFSDANDADQSAAGETTEDNEGTSEVEDSDERPVAHVARAPTAPVQEPDVGEEEDTTEGETEEEEIDEETRRRMELRERMAKMSGGMGMPGMFGMPMPGPVPQKKRSTKDKERKPDAEPEETPASPPQQRIPMIPIPGMQSMRSPESEDTQLAVEKEDELDNTITDERAADVVPDVEDVKPEPAPRAKPTEHEEPPRVSQERPVPPPPSADRGPAPPVPGDRPVPRPPPVDSRPVPPPPSQVPMSPSAGSESDDEMSVHVERLPGGIGASDASLSTRQAPPPVPTAQAVPPRPEGARSPQSAAAKRASYFGNDTTSPISPVTPASDRRASRVPPIPGSSPVVGSPPASARPPPPPPPAVPAVETRSLEGSTDEPEERESEYEGDYDTDIASGVKHKDALRSHAREPSLDDSTTADETPVHTPLPSAPPPPIHRAVPPPPPPTQAPQTRASMDAPRAAPPPIPIRSATAPGEEEYDPYRYMEQSRAPPPLPPSAPAPPPMSREPEEIQEDSSDDMYSASPPKRSMDRPPPPPPNAQDRPVPPPPTQHAPPPGPPPAHAAPPSHPPPRQSLDVNRSVGGRRSMDQGRPSNDGHIATDVDLAESTQWWAQPNQPPPTFQGRNDVLVEIEESSTSKRGGKTTISKDVYVLFLDYSQTVITARFDARDPADCSLEQRHEPPPPRLRQDQLEECWQRFGRRIAEEASQRKDHVVGDGSPNALVLDLIKPLQGALLPVGTRAYGALVYANLANASVQQFDEIRAGDVITLRNAKLQGKHGTMHQKYAVDVGMGAGHVGVVVDWDGTKKKVRVWEQGREKGKVRLESFRLGDLRSGEVRVWRVVGRGWVGWE